MSVLTERLAVFRNRAREVAGRVLARPIGYVTAWWERLAPRQRKLFVSFVATGLGLLTIFGTWTVFSTISDLEDGNAAIRDALKAIATNRDAYLDAKARGAAQEARIGTDPPQLTGDIEAAAHEETLEIAESSERPATPAGRRYLEHDVDIKMRGVGLQPLTKFMRRLETGPRLVFFTHFSLKRNFAY